MVASVSKGRAKKLIEELLMKRSKGNQTIMNTTKVKLMARGIPIHKITDDSIDDEELIAKIYAVAKELQIELSQN